MLRVGFIGWRGMVGSVLMQRMREENDFAELKPVFFSTSNVGRRSTARSRAPERFCRMRAIWNTRGVRRADQLPGG